MASKDNDTRGWIMTCVSGIACIPASSIICVALIVRRFPGKNHFKIQDSSTFLSSSLSLSAGVMLFSALYSMLPSSSDSFQKGGLSPQAAAWALIGCFLGGVVGIQLISRILHHSIPSRKVDCDHTHEDDGHTAERKHDANGHHIEPHHADHEHSHLHSQSYAHVGDGRPPPPIASESTPLLQTPQKLSRDSSPDQSQHRQQSSSAAEGGRSAQYRLPTLASGSLRPSLQARLNNRIASFVRGEMASCQKDQNGLCFGYSDPCGHECLKITQSRIPERSSTSDEPASKDPRLLRSATAPPARRQASQSTSSDSRPEEGQEQHQGTACSQSSQDSRTLHESHANNTANYDDSNVDLEQGHEDEDENEHHHTQVHHHHVPENAFLSIGLQTSIAIALHKMPEGFITFATNHANPELGFAVFMALFIHNITEGFALALPLYLALNSRWKAMFWSSLLGGVSQPLGALVAALWFKVARRGEMAPGEGVYGAMFAVTSGIMTSVALQLFSESLGLNHNRGLCIAFAFVGMGILGFSYALTAK